MGPVDLAVSWLKIAKLGGLQYRSQSARILVMGAPKGDPYLWESPILITQGVMSRDPSPSRKVQQSLEFVSGRRVRDFWRVALGFQHCASGY